MPIHCVQPPRRDAWEASPHCHGMARCARTSRGYIDRGFDPICGPRPSKLPRPSSPEGTGYLRAGRSAEGPNCQNTLQPSGPEGNGYYPGRAKRGDSTRRGESVGEEGCSFKQGVRQSEACRFKQGEKQSEACCARRKRASRVECSSMVTSSLGLVTKRDQPRVGVRGSRHQKRPIAAWSSHQKRKCALGGRHAEQATHATRHGEHALLPKQLCRQAQLELDTSAWRSCGKRAAWHCRKVSAQDVRAALHARMERATQ